MTLDEILAELKVKYQLSSLDDKQLKKHNLDEENYNVFINNLINILHKQRGYIFEIFPRLSLILSIVNKNIYKNKRDYNEKEIELYNYTESILNESYASLLDYKSQYESICKYNHLPVFCSEDYSFDKTMYSNYINFSYFINYMDGKCSNEILKDDKSFLITVNDLLFNYSDQLDRDILNEFYEIIDSSNYYDRTYSRNLANKINKKITKRKILAELNNKTNDYNNTDKVKKIRK